MVENPPDFRISPICCQKAKKDTAHRAQKEIDADLIVQGVRKAEGGTRSTAIHSCFSQNAFQADVLRPLFWFKKDDCEKYDNLFGVEHSACYTQYGLRRTGCACCPFGKDFEYELDAAKRYEPKLYKLANLVFGKSYEYMRKYKEFRRKKEKEEKEQKD